MATPVQPVIGKSNPTQKLCFCSRFDPRLDDWRIKTSPNLTKFCRHDHKDLVNIPTKRIDESLHGLGGIQEFPSKNGVFLEHENFDLRRLVIP